MNKFVKTLGVAAVAGAVALTAVGPAAAQPFGWWGWHPHHYHRVYAPAYYPGYYPGYYSGYYPGYYYDPGAAVAAGLIGGIFGTIIHHAVGGGCFHVYHHNGRTYCR